MKKHLYLGLAAALIVAVALVLFLVFGPSGGRKVTKSVAHQGPLAHIPAKETPKPVHQPLHPVVETSTVKADPVQAPTGKLKVLPRKHIPAENGIPIDELSAHSALGLVEIQIQGKNLPAEVAVAAHRGQTVAFRITSDRVGTISLSGFGYSTKTIPGKTVELRATVQQFSTYTLSFDGKPVATLLVKP